MSTAVKQKKKRRTARVSLWFLIAIGVLLLLLIALLVAFVIVPAIKGGGENASVSDFFDSNARSGSLPGKTEEEIQAELNKIVEEGMFNISIASIVTVQKGSDEALVRIENIAANHHNMTVRITLDGEDDPIYESAGLAPGQYIEYGKLNRKLAAGEYNATALFTAYNTADLTQAGQAAARITIVVS